jgi:hypothetical protein
MARQNSRLGTGFSIPDTCRVIERGGYDVLAIRTDGGIIYVRCVSPQYCNLFASGHIPDACCRSSRDDDPGAVGTEGCNIHEW